MGNRRQVKAPIQTQRAVVCLHYVTQTKNFTRKAKAVVRSSLVPHIVLLIPPGHNRG